MSLTYEVTEKGYKIFNNSQVWIVQEGYTPFPAASFEESAKLHIQDLEQPAEEVPAYSVEVELEKVKAENAALNLQIIDIYEILINGGLA